MVNFLIIAFVIFVIVKFLNRMSVDTARAEQIKADADARAEAKEKAVEKK